MRPLSHLTSSERHNAAPWLNEKQSEETGNNPRQVPAGCHKKRVCLSSLSPHAFSFNTMSWWKINGLTGQPLLCLMSATEPGSKPITKHQEKKEEWGRTSIFRNTKWMIIEIVQPDWLLRNVECFQLVGHIPTQFNPDLSLGPHLPYLTLFTTLLTLHPLFPGASL